MNAQSYVGSKPEEVLRTVFGYESFRHSQADIIKNVLKGKDTLAVMPTGGGKSLCYQIPALIFEGITIVISPLISLMQDQVSSLDAAGVPSVFINSTLEWEEFLEHQAEIKRGNVKIVYISPEGLSSNKIREMLSSEQIQVSCVTIDEAHCVSEWGHDFRPDYLEISQVRKMCPSAVMLALTATATKQVQKDIVKNLGMNSPDIFVSSFNRPNIYLSVKPKIAALDLVCECIERHKDESGIIYCTSRRQVDELATSLKHLKYSVKSYHAGLSPDVRSKNQNSFIIGKTKIIVATVAFGMGIDVPDVRFVINYDLPKSIEEYYQEIGRAGRDGKPAEALLLYSRADIHKIRYFFEDVADKAKAENLLQAMVNYATVKTCRRQTLLWYFGEKYLPSGQAAQSGHQSGKAISGSSGKFPCCDICSRGTVPLNDVTIPVQKFLCCMIRTDERFGAAYVIDVLLGVRSKRIKENGHNKVSTFGIGRGIEKDKWFELSEMLVDKGYVRKDGKYNVLKLTSLARDVLRTREQVWLPIRMEEAE